MDWEDDETRSDYGGDEWATARYPTDEEIQEVLEAELRAEAARIDREREAQQAHRARPHLL